MNLVWRAQPVNVNTRFFHARGSLASKMFYLPRYASALRLAVSGRASLDPSLRPGTVRGPCTGKSLARARGVHTSSVQQSPASVEESSQFVVCGAGAGGLAVAARLGRKFGEGKVTIVDPAEVCTHMYLA